MTEYEMSDKEFLRAYFPTVAKLLRAGQPMNLECHRMREALRARLSAIMRKREYRQ